MTNYQEVSDPTVERSFKDSNYRAKILQNPRAQQQNGVTARRDNVSEHQKAITLNYNGNTQYIHGPGGVLNQPGVDQGIASTLYRPMGVSRLLPFSPSQVVTPIMETLTSQNSDVGSEPSDECSAPVSAGNLNVASLTAPFGLVQRSTPTITATRPGQVVNRADPLDLRLINDATTLSPLIPDPAKQPDFINTEYGTQLYKLGVSYERILERQVFTGSPSNNVGTGYKEFVGYDTLINTGHIDLVTGTLVPALDSLLVNWNSANITGNVSLAGANYNIVQTLSAMCNFLYSKAMRTGALPCEWALMMRYDCFWELTNLWPISYLTNGASVVPANSTLYVGSVDQISMRDDMRTGQFLWINGMKYPVLITDGPTVTANGIGQKSTIYIVALSAFGSIINYMQFYDFTNQQLGQIEDTPIGNRYWVSNGGMYFWTYTTSGMCLTVQAEIQPRMILRMPWLCARLQNVSYSTPVPTNSAFPGDLYSYPGGGSAVGSYNPAALYPTAY